MCSATVANSATPSPPPVHPYTYPHAYPPSYPHTHPVSPSSSPSWCDNMNQLKSELRQFYLDHPPDISMITDLNRRHFRMVLPNGRFLKIKDVIRNTDDLQKWLQRLAPLHVYYTTGTWLNPVILSPRPKERGSGFLDSGIILSHDIAFDIDRTPLLKRNIEAARQESLRLLDHMTGQGYELKYIAFSGSKGFHVVFRDKEREIIPDPYEREMEFIRERTELTKEILDAGIDIDTTVTKDTRRIIRVPGTINTRTGYACTVIDRTDLEVPFREFIRKIPHTPSVERIPSFVIPKFEVPISVRTAVGDIGGRIVPRKGWTKLRGALRGKEDGKGGLEHRAGQGYFYTTFLQSNVLGTNGRHAVLLSFRDRSPDTVAGALPALIEEFNLTDFHLFSLPGRVIALCLKTVQKNQYQRIIDAARADNAAQLMKYSVVSIRVGPLVAMDMKEIEGPMLYHSTVRAPEEQNARNFVSRGHLNFVRKHGIIPFAYPNVHGNTEFKVVDAILKM